MRATGLSFQIVRKALTLIYEEMRDMDTRETKWLVHSTVFAFSI